MKYTQDFESIHAGKFSPLTTTQKLAVKGGVKTAGGTQITHYNYKIVDGVPYRQPVIKSWSSDEIDGKDECYENLERCVGEWVAY